MEQFFHPIMNHPYLTIVPSTAVPNTHLCEARSTYFLSPVDLVDDLELGDPPLDDVEELLGSEAHGVHVVRAARQVLLRRDHHLGVANGRVRG